MQKNYIALYASPRIPQGNLTTSKLIYDKHIHLTHSINPQLDITNSKTSVNIALQFNTKLSDFQPLIYSRRLYKGLERNVKRSMHFQETRNTQKVLETFPNLYIHYH